MVIYRSFVEAIDLLSDEDAGRLYKAITKYALDDITPTFEGCLQGYFSLIKPQIDANNKRYENGLKGGRPPKPKDNQTITNIKPKLNQNKTKIKPNDNQNKTKQKPNENENENENENVNVIVSKTRTPKHKYGTYQKVMLTDEEHSKLIKEYGEDKATAAIQFLDEYIAEKSYKSKSHYLAIRRWVISALDERKVKKPANNLGVFGDYKQTSTDSEWEDLMDMQFKEING